MAVTSSEKLSKLDEKIKQLQAQKHSLLAREKEKERKARTRKLIEMGASLNQIGIETQEQLNKFIEEYKNNEKCKYWLNEIINK